ARLQRCWRIGHSCRVRLQIGFLLSIASPVGIRKLIESRHLGIEAAAFDRRHQSRTIELGVAQVRAIGHLAVGFPAITRPAMTRLAIAFLLVKPHPIGNVGGAWRLRVLSHGWERDKSRGYNHDRNCATRKETPQNGLLAYSHRALPAAALFSLFESIEQARGICPRERIQAMGLALLDGITRDGPFSAKKLGFLLHFVVPSVLV